MPPAIANVTRHLATVLAADAVGFTRRMQENQRATVTALFECRAILAEVVDTFHGFTVDTPGDFFLARMPSGIEAVEAALEIQRRVAERNRTVAEESQAQYRIGIGIGDVYEHGSEVLGDAVNIAARLQGIATPGNIVASGAVRSVVGAQPGVAFDDLGDHELKGIAAPVRVYAVRRADQRRTERPGQQSSVAGRNPVVVDRLPIKPVVEIEPFRALGSTEGERLFAEGIGDELMAMLAGLGNSLVVRQVAESQAPLSPGGPVRRYRLGGSVRCGAGQARIIARLSEAGSGDALWADRFEYSGEQSFDAHEVIARQVVTALQVNLTEGEQAQLWGRGTTSVRAWEMFQRGHDLERRFTRHGHLEARRCYEEALQHDPSYVSAIVALAFCHLDEIRLGWTAAEARSFAEAERLYARATAINADDAQCHALEAYVELHKRNDKAAVAAMERAAKLAPRSGELAAYLGNIYDTVGRYDDAIVAYRRAIWLSQHAPSWIATNLGLTLCVIGRADEARKLLLGVITHHPDYSRAHLALCIAYARLNQPEGARQAVAELRRLDPLFTIADWARDRPYADPKVMEALTADLRAVGLT